jgi:hypothetical protein
MNVVPTSLLVLVNMGFIEVLSIRIDVYASDQSEAVSLDVVF